MEPQDKSATFDAGAGVVANDAFRSEGASFGAPVKKSGGVWKIVSIIAIVLVVVAGAGAGWFFVQANDADKKVSDLQAQISAKNAELAELSEATEGEDLTATLAGIHKALDDRLESVFYVTLDHAFIKNSADGDYKIASFGVVEYADDALGSGFTAFLYRGVDDDIWTFSNFSGQAVPACADVSEAEQKAFEGVLECTAE